MTPWTGLNKPVQNVGLIGVGTMGRRILQKLMEAGYIVTACDPFPDAAEYAASVGAFVVKTPQELAQECSLILMSLPGPIQIEQVIFGQNGMDGMLTSDHVVIDTSTVDPTTSRDIASRLQEKGTAYLDCPVLGRPEAVGKWILPTGGDPIVLDYVKPVLLTFAANAVSVGDHGAGNAIKLLNQMMFSAINAVSAEVMVIADKVGVSKEMFYQTISNSSAATVSGLFRDVGKNIVAGDFDHPTFTVDLLIKDTNLALQMAKDAKAPSVITGTVQLYNEIASANGLGKEDTSALYKVYARHYKED